MAMSRSLGASLFTTLPPMRSSPSLMSSRPAIMLRVVDLPQPDGPTRIMNSPSAMSRFILSTASAPSGYLLVTFSRMISATATPVLRADLRADVRLALDRAGRQPGHDAALEEHDEDDDRDGDDHRRRRQRGDDHGEGLERGGPVHLGRLL